MAFLCPLVLLVCAVWGLCWCWQTLPRMLLHRFSPCGAWCGQQPRCTALGDPEVLDLFWHWGFFCCCRVHKARVPTVPHRQVSVQLLWLEEPFQLLINVNCGSSRNAGPCCSFSVASQIWPASWLLSRHSFSSSKDSWWPALLDEDETKKFYLNILTPSDISLPQEWSWPHLTRIRNFWKKKMSQFWKKSNCW